eukprot:1160404-Pelagomonas_calceolata.AAC.2
MAATRMDLVAGPAVGQAPVQVKAAMLAALTLCATGCTTGLSMWTVRRCPSPWAISSPSEM